MRVQLIGIAGDHRNFLLSLYNLKAYANRFPVIQDQVEIQVNQYPYIPVYIKPPYVQEEVHKILWDICEYKPDLVGFACYVWNMEIIENLAFMINKHLPDTKVLFGGPEITKDIIINRPVQFKHVDFLIFGEGEAPFKQLVRALVIDNPLLYSSILGLACKNDIGFFAPHKKSRVMDDLDLIPSPYLRGYIPDSVLTQKGIRANFETQRGCNFKCAYCVAHKDRSSVAYRDPDTVINEIMYANNRGVIEGRIVDSNFFSNKHHAKAILQGLIRNGIRMSLVLEALPQFITEEMAYLLGYYIKESPQNKIVVGMGVQSTNPDVLKVIKRYTPIHNFDIAFSRLQKQKVIIKTDLILGLPLETRKSYFDSLEYVAEKMRHGSNFLSLAHLRVLPGSQLQSIVGPLNKIFGILELDERDTNHFVYRTSTMSRTDMVECLRLNAIAFRVLCSLDDKVRMETRDMYFKILDRYNFSHIELLETLMICFMEYLERKNTNFTKPDFSDAERYYQEKIHTDIPDDWLLCELELLYRE